MAKRRVKRLTQLEALIMDCVWSMTEELRTAASVRDVQEQLEPVKPMAYNTVLTVMRILRDKGFLGSKREGRMDMYRPLVTRDQMGRRSLREVLDRFFAGSAGALVSQLVESENLSPDEIEAVRRELDKKLRARAETGEVPDDTGSGAA